jgi:hypothetical protein
MASADLTILVLETFADTMKYLLPVIGVMAVVNFVFHIIIRVTFGVGRELR